jgi:hypothetical protein
LGITFVGASVKLEPLARELMRLGSPETGRSSRAVVVAEDVQMTLVRQCCGENFVHVLENKLKARSLKDWRCHDPECRLKVVTLPFGKFKGQTLSWVYEQEQSYLAWFHETVDGCEEVKEAIRGLKGIETHLTAFRQGRQPASQKRLSATQQEVEWLMGKFSASTIDAVCSELFGGEG